MGAPLGNRFWRARSSHGLKSKVETPEQLETLCNEYFDWVEDNPLWEEKGFAFQGLVTHEKFSKMRAMTISGLCNFIGITPITWRDWRKNREDLSAIVAWADRIIYQQKFEGASADLLNSSIIARDLGLAEKREITGADGAPLSVVTTEMSVKEAAIAYAATIKGFDS